MATKINKQKLNFLSDFFAKNPGKKFIYNFFFENFKITVFPKCLLDSFIVLIRHRVLFHFYTTLKMLLSNEDKRII